MLALPLAVAFGQTDFEAGWKAVGKLFDDEQYTKAYSRAEELYKDAVRLGDSRNMLAGAFHMARIEAEYRENAADSALNRYLSLIDRLDAVDQALCHAFIARFYQEYSIANRWIIRSNKATDEAELDYKLWPQERFDSEIERHIGLALKDKAALQAAPIESAAAFCSKPLGDGLLTTPTLYDLVMNLAIECLNPSEQLRLIDELVDFHKTDEVCLRVWLDLWRLSIEASVPNRADPTAETYMQYAEKYGTACEMVTKFNYRAAMLLFNQQRYVEAKELCDKAVAIFPESEGGLECSNLVSHILHRECSVKMVREELSAHAMLAVTTCRNVETVYFRIIKQFDHIRVYDHKEIVELMAKQKPLKEWSQAAPRRDDYREQKIYTYLPEMEAGEYYLLISASGDFRSEGLSYGEFVCCNAQIVSVLDDNALRGYLVRRTDGQPIAGQTVRLDRYDYGKNRYESTGVTATTDAEGYYQFDNQQSNGSGSLRVSTVIDGMTLSNGASNHTEPSHHSNVSLYCQMDRPVYKLGETVSFAYVVHYGDRRTQERVCQGAKLYVQLRDVNDKTVDSVRLVTDGFGVAHGALKVPADALPGSFRLRTEYEVDGKKDTDYENVKVEEYKQPKFMVKLYGDGERHAFGRELAVSGLAASYSQVPIDGARVKYSVVRREMYRPWRWWYMPLGRETTVTGGETVTDAEGRFELRFTPQPDSSVELSNKPCFVYTVTAEVTDLNGETHSQSYRLHVGYENSHISLPQGGEVERLDTLQVDYANLDGDPIEGKVTVCVERLRQPSQPRLRHTLLDTAARHSLSREEFAQRFGLLAYDRQDIDPDLWTVERKVLTRTLTMTKEGGGEVALGRLDAGTYRVTATATDPDGNKLETHTTYIYMPADGTKVQSQELLWASDGGRNSLQPGDTYRLRLGSRYKGVRVLCVLSCEGEPLERRVVTLDGDVATLEFPIAESHKGGVRLDLLAMKENQVCKRDFNIDVPYSDKHLDVRIETFRDKLQPGQTETWTIRVSEKNSNSQAIKQSSNLMLTMYDAALDTYGSLRASLSPWSGNYNPSLLDWTDGRFALRDYQFGPSVKYVPSASLRTWHLLDGIYSYNRHRFTKYFKNSIAFNESLPDAAPARGEVLMEIKAPVATEEDAMDGGTDDSAEESGGDEPQVRENLNTLAFFYPTLRTGDDGTVECSFTVPELLTEWSIRGVAHTQDLKTGSLAKSLVTQKELMVQPNVPRFLRHGDTLDFMAKVVNMTDNELPTTVTFDLTDAANGQTVVGDQQTVVTVPARRSAQVSFRVAVPKDVYVANYRIVARSQNFSDGEQGAIPVLTNRQFVTVSQSMYINGKGEKRYNLPAFSGQQSASREPMLLKVEFTSNPMWYAIQALPYVEDRQNPSNIFLANRLYTNTMAYGIVESNPSIETVFRQWESDTVNPLVSQLEKNEDVKQTVLDETPWLRDGTGETERMHRIAQYFDKKKLSGELSRTERMLFAQQRHDGGWSWLPDGKISSLYTTQYILETLGKLAVGSRQSAVGSRQSDIKKALKYVDKETYDYYLRYLKHTDFEALNIDYLYMRSFYTDCKFDNSKYKEAYDYFYSNTLKHYHEYKSLRTRAQLALVFYRAGDHRQALDIVNRLKESALYSDEMGMYWRDNQSGWWWYERPVETQALLIQAFAEITPDDRQSIGLMQQWLLKQKQTTSWSSDVASVEAISALLAVKTDGTPVPSLTDSETSTLVAVAGQPMTTPAQAGTGYRSQSWHGSEIADLIGQGEPEVRITKTTDGIAWGAAYYQFFDDMDKIERNEMGVKLSKTIYRVGTDGTMQAVTAQSLAVGDRVRVRMLIDCDRNLEYIELKDPRGGCFEPVSTASGWRWNSGLSYYVAVRNASNSFYIDRLDKGKYVVEYDLYVTNHGTFTLPAATIQCLYAPEFRTNAEGRRLQVK